LHNLFYGLRSAISLFSGKQGEEEILVWGIADWQTILVCSLSDKSERRKTRSGAFSFIILLDLLERSDVFAR